MSNPGLEGNAHRQHTAQSTEATGVHDFAEQTIHVPATLSHAPSETTRNANSGYDDHDNHQRQVQLDTKTRKRPWNWFLKHLRITNPPGPAQYRPGGYQEDYIRRALVEIDAPDGRSIAHWGVISFDTQCPLNYISSRFAKKFDLPRERDAHSDEETFTTFVGEEVNSCGRVVARWHVDQSPDQKRHGRLNFDPRFEETEFIISDSSERYDMMIGRNTINDSDIIGRKRPFVAVHWRQKPNTFDSECVELSRQRR
ncbi:hypothetical protein EJ04DRAFT_524984 [Polyplosphaeria fusca]|uniref:Uncharacterized protein n=1 Tax=Polyplosphaeria fusca TaxID=682080 RepID=A0A9P4QX55_9PLEO|nr:hypothetical protein EJ04DRAFT_524984 [Polyplosphaeria fusca]